MKNKYSASKINSFKQCKKLYKLRYLDKIKTDSKPKALERGDLIHRLLEHYLKTDSKPNIEKFKNDMTVLNNDDIMSCSVIVDKFGISEMYKVIRSLPFKKYIENKFFLNSKLEPCDYTSYIFSGKIDFYTIDNKKKIGLNIDWKTGGKFSDKYPLDMLQLNSYSLWLIQKYKLLGVKSKYYYVEYDKIAESILTANDVDSFKEKLLNDIMDIENCKNYEPTLSELCNYCEYSEQCA